MSGGLQRFEPDGIYCVYCHQEAAGPCATCAAMICADCGVLTGGAVKKAVVCERCHSQGRGAVGWEAWKGVVKVVAAVLVGVWVLGLALRACV